MKLLYTRENRYLVHNIQNVVENAGIETILKNEYAAGAVGDLVPHESWLELWVLNNIDYDRAVLLIENMLDTTKPDWICTQCQEVNTASFEFCWRCQTEHA